MGRRLTNASVFSTKISFTVFVKANPAKANLMTYHPSDSEISWPQRLSATSDTEDLLSSLGELSSQENVPGVARVCLELLAHEDSEVRVWAAEALESSAAPGAEETEGLAGWLEKLLDQQSAAMKKPFAWPSSEKTPEKPPTDKKTSADVDAAMADSLLADQLYWTATMLGRIGIGAAAADPMLARLESLGEISDAKPFHDAASRAARMRKRIT